MKIDLPNTIKNIMYYKGDKINPNSKLILLHFLQIMDWKTCRVITTVKSTSIQLSIAEKTVRNCIDKLVKADLIKVSPKRSRGLKSANEYQLLGRSIKRLIDAPKPLESSSGKSYPLNPQNNPKPLESSSGKFYPSIGKSYPNESVKNTHSIGKIYPNESVKFTQPFHIEDHTSSHIEEHKVILDTTSQKKPVINPPLKEAKKEEGYNPWKSGQRKVDFAKARRNVLKKNNWGEWV